MVKYLPGPRSPCGAGPSEQQCGYLDSIVRGSFLAPWLWWGWGEQQLRMIWLLSTRTCFPCRVSLNWGAELSPRQGAPSLHYCCKVTTLLSTLHVRLTRNGVAT